MIKYTHKIAGTGDEARYGLMQSVSFYDIDFVFLKL